MATTLAISLEKQIIKLGEQHKYGQLQKLLTNVTAQQLSTIKRGHK